MRVPKLIFFFPIGSFPAVAIGFIIELLPPLVLPSVLEEERLIEEARSLTTLHELFAALKPPDLTLPNLLRKERTFAVVC